jgi:hypothetical protein
LEINWLLELNAPRQNATVLPCHFLVAHSHQRKGTPIRISNAASSAMMAEKIVIANTISHNFLTLTRQIEPGAGD